MHTKTTTFEAVRASTDSEWLMDVAGHCHEDPAEPEKCPNCLAYMRAQELDEKQATEAEVRLSRHDVEMAVDAVGDCTDWGHAGALRGLMPTFVAAARALLRVMEPASVAEIHGEAFDSQALTRHFAVGYRAAEARARRVAGWEVEP